jgi:hypothetical protein
MWVNKDRLLESLYGHCQDRSLGTKDVLGKVFHDLGVVPDNTQVEQLTDIVRRYKNSGKNLEETVNIVHGILTEPKVTSFDQVDMDKDMD